MLIPFFPLTVFGPSPDRRGQVCPRCGALTSSTARFCRACGLAFAQPARSVCPKCGSESPPEARFCANCGHDSQPLPPCGPPSQSGRPQTEIPQTTGPVPRQRKRVLPLALVGCGSILLLGLLAAGGYLGYRYWWTGPGHQETAVTTPESSSAEVDWEGAPVSPPDLSASQAHVSPHLDRLSAALKAGQIDTALSLTLPELRKDLESSLEGRPERMERLAQLLETRRLIAIEGDLAEFEVTEEGRRFSVTLQRVRDVWLLHSF